MENNYVDLVKQFVDEEDLTKKQSLSYEINVKSDTNDPLIERCSTRPVRLW